MPMAEIQDAGGFRAGDGSHVPAANEAFVPPVEAPG